MTPRTEWVLALALAGHEIGGEARDLPEPWRGRVEHLASIALEDRQAAWDAMLAGQPDRDEIILAVANVDLTGPPPEDDPPIQPATLADVCRVMADEQWLWEGYLPAARIAGIAAYEGVGKTRLAMDLARRLWEGLPWPDGQPATLPKRTRTLWVCADRHQAELVGIAKEFGMPRESVVLNTTRGEFYGGTELDTQEDRDRLESRINRIRPGLVFIDTLTNATNYDLCRATENKAMMTPLCDIAQRTKTTITPLLHLSREGQALGRRIKGLTRTILQLDCPDPEQPARLRLSVSKSFAKKPPALGVTMADGGNEYDHTPPTGPVPGRAGRKPEARDKAEQFIRDALTRQNDRIGTDLADEWIGTGGSKATFWRAVDTMAEAGELMKDGGPGMGKQVVLHLINPGSDPTPDTDPDRPF